MRVDEVLELKGREVMTVTPDATVSDAAQLLNGHRLGALVVSSNGSTIDGIISERDIVRSVAENGAAALQTAVADVMTTKVLCCDRERALGDLMGLMTERRIRHVPVLESEALVGIISIGDVVKHHLTVLEDERDHLERYITTGR